ncbi:hypothetical protein EDEG_00450 [Edhazardia aedis USNM 41457]|uniref:AMP-dependent synthetase/ligase domain-containing protein n=1 Tax=Edhazardia aedis (strain USNM 41457) TaxID=1003232 RepID=J8ZP28_EDHAE|nr:hypothetical protein EDEG_00450 [Edhazardia aedis USNM 41457]|eukprot:EJW01458.1 hypothetical protein EDEG_00450 [Edhazardia aedis USNM 41457]
MCVKYKIFWQKRGYYKSYLLDSLIFNKIRNEFGGKLKVAMNGSAPLASSVSEYLQAVMSMRIVQGYGQTEATAANILTNLGDYSNDRVGIPFPTNLVKLIPTEDYDGTLKGEICLKGPNVTSGYYKRSQMSDSLFTQDGWLKTGDIGEINNSYQDILAFKIVGRRKEIFKTSLGEYIIPEKIENLFKGGHIEDILITGLSYGNYIVALVVCKDKNVSVTELQNYVKQRGDELYKQSALTRYEIPRKIYVLRNDFENFGELLTPTMKKKRNKIETFFEAEIKELYDQK